MSRMTKDVLLLGSILLPAVAAAKQHLRSFGVASVCGYRRCNPAEFEHALDLHRMAGRDFSQARSS